MQNKNISIEFATSVIADLIGYSFNMMQKPELDTVSKFLWKQFLEKLHSERTRLYSSKGNPEDVKYIIDKIDNEYCPFLKNELR